MSYRSNIQIFIEKCSKIKKLLGLSGVVSYLFPPLNNIQKYYKLFCFYRLNYSILQVSIDEFINLLEHLQQLILEYHLYYLFVAGQINVRHPLNCVHQV